MRGRPKGSTGKEIGPRNMPGPRLEPSSGVFMPAWLERLPYLLPTTKLVYATLLKYRTDREWRVRRSMGLLASRVGTGINVRTLRRHLRDLEEAGLIGVSFDGRVNEIRFFEHRWMYEAPTIQGRATPDIRVRSDRTPVSAVGGLDG